MFVSGPAVTSPAVRSIATSLPLPGLPPLTVASPPLALPLAAPLRPPPISTLRHLPRAGPEAPPPDRVASDPAGETPTKVLVWVLVPDR